MTVRRHNASGHQQIFHLPGSKNRPYPYSITRRISGESDQPSYEAFVRCFRNMHLKTVPLPLPPLILVLFWIPFCSGSLIISFGLPYGTPPHLFNASFFCYYCKLACLFLHDLFPPGFYLHCLYAATSHHEGWERLEPKAFL